MNWQVKLTSGKFWFTIVTSWVFAYAVHAKLLTSEQINAIIMTVIAAYFGRYTNNGNGETK